MKAVIPIAGLGTRMMSITKGAAKEMLPIFNKPIIHHIIDECIESGFYDLIFISNSSKKAVQSSIEQYVKNILPTAITIDSKTKNTLTFDESLTIKTQFVFQNSPKGLGDAIKCAGSHVDSEPFAVILPDILISSGSYKSKTPYLKMMKAEFHKTQLSQILVHPVDMSEIEKYGVAYCTDDYATKIVTVVEKPKRTEAKSNLAIVGRYILSYEIIGCLEKTYSGHNKEIQLTDALQMLIDLEGSHIYKMNDSFIDYGNIKGWSQVNAALCQ